MRSSVLIIDDDPGVIAALAARLEFAGYRVHRAHGGVAGVAAVGEHRPDVILLDVRMPDLDGFEVCARIAAPPDHSRTPIVFLTANVQDSTRQRALDAGGNAVLGKPYEARDVIAAIETVVAGCDDTATEDPEHA